MTRSGIELEGPLLGVACGDALGRPVEGLSSAEIAHEYGRVTELYADGVAGEAAGTVTACTRDALAVARELYGTGGVGEGGADERGVGEGGADERGARETASGARGERRSFDGEATLLARVVPCAGLPADARESAVAWAAGDVSSEARAAASAFVDTLVALGGGAEPAAALQSALDRASERGAPAALRTVLAVALDPVERHGDSVVDTLEVAAHEAGTAADAAEAVVAAVSRGGPTTRLGAATGALAGARFGSKFPGEWLDRLETAEILEVAGLRTE